MFSQNQLLIILVATVGIILFTWFASLKERRYHGIPRFISFESILLLLMHNHQNWFVNAFAPLQILSWLLFLISAFFALYGSMQIILRGRPQGNFENTTQLVTTGLFEYIRHPMYASLLYFGLGIYLKAPDDLFNIILVIINSIALYITCRIKEKEMTKRFGATYRIYINQTRLFIPFIF